ncbi:MAG: hypothetical protein P8078_05505 [bacterium]
MKSMPEQLKKIIKDFTEDINKFFGKEVKAIILYGSAATEEYIPGKSDVNFLVCLSESGIEKINIVSVKVRSWQGHNISVPLFLTTSYIQESLDSFPVEFFNISQTYQVIQGEDILKDLKFNKKDVRLQCERELKGKLLTLRQGYILTRGKRKKMSALINESMVTFTSIFKALLFLKDSEVPVKKSDVILSMCREFDLDESIFSILLAHRNNSVKVSKEQLQAILKKYIKEIQNLSKAVDSL